MEASNGQIERNSVFRIFQKSVLNSRTNHLISAEFIFKVLGILIELLHRGLVCFRFFIVSIVSYTEINVLYRCNIFTEWVLYWKDVYGRRSILGVFCFSMCVNVLCVWMCLLSLVYGVHNFLDYPYTILWFNSCNFSYDIMILNKPPSI